MIKDNAYFNVLTEMLMKDQIITEQKRIIKEMKATIKNLGDELNATRQLLHMKELGY